VPHVLTGSPLGAYLLQTLVNLATAGVLAVVLVRALTAADVTLERRDRLLVGGVVVASIHSIPVLVMGQVNLQLALAIAVGAGLLERGRETGAGVAFALAAAVKLFPAVVGLWLLRLRSWRAVATAVATGLGTIVAGAAVFGLGPTRTFFTAVVPGERQAGAFTGGLDPSTMFVTIRRPLAALLPGLGADALALLALAILVPVVLAASRDVSSEVGRSLALLATLLGTLLYLPLEPFYYSLLYYPLLLALYRVEPGRSRRLLLVGTVVLSMVVSYPSVERLLVVLPLGSDTAAAVDAVTRGVFSVAQPPLIGALLLLAGCVSWHHERPSTATAEPSERPATK